MTKLTTITEDQFDDRYTLLRNHLNPNATWAYGDENGCMFEAYGAELDFVRQQNPRCVWTFMDGDDGEYLVVNGIYPFQGIGFLISTEPVPYGSEVVVMIPEEDAP